MGPISASLTDKGHAVRLHQHNPVISTQLVYSYSTFQGRLVAGIASIATTVVAVVIAAVVVVTSLAAFADATFVVVVIIVAAVVVATCRHIGYMLAAIAIVTMSSSPLPHQQKYIGFDSRFRIAFGSFAL
ncbi:hypothetical protein V8E53_006836 [Lactarius tabidus]